MKKLIKTLLVSFVLFISVGTLTQCRETPEDKAEDAVEEVENAAEDAADEAEDAAEEVGEAVEETAEEIEN